MSTRRLTPHRITARPYVEDVRVRLRTLDNRIEVSPELVIVYDASADHEDRRWLQDVAADFVYSFPHYLKSRQRELALPPREGEQQ